LGLQLAAPTATTIIIRTPAHLTATTALTGLQAACLSAPVRGMAGDVAGAMVAGATATMAAAAGVELDSPVDEGLTAPEALPVGAALPAVRPAASMVVRYVAGAASTEARLTAVAVGSTAAAVDTAEGDTGDRGAIRGCERFG